MRRIYLRNMMASLRQSAEGYTHPVSAEENKAIFRRYIEEVGNQGNLELADEIFDRYLAHQPDGSVLERGPEDVKRFTGEFREAFHGYHATVELQIAEEDLVATRWRLRGNHQGEFRSMAATGKVMEIRGSVSSVSRTERWWRAGTPSTSSA
jgi:hypothetical protein